MNRGKVSKTYVKLDLKGIERGAETVTRVKILEHVAMCHQYLHTQYQLQLRRHYLFLLYMEGRLDCRDKIGKRVVCVPQKGGVLGGSIGRKTRRILDPNCRDGDFARRFEITIEGVRYDATTCSRDAHAIMV